MWGRVLLMDTFDEAMTSAFYKQWGGLTNPENGAAPGPELEADADPGHDPGPERLRVRGAERVRGAQRVGGAELVRGAERVGGRQPLPELTEETADAPRLVHRVG